MAITATFQANFDQFVREVKRADTALHGMGTSATKVSTESITSLGNMGNAARSLAGTFGIAFSIGGLVQFGRSVLEAGSNIQKMSEQMGIGTTEVQRFMHIAGQSDTSVKSLVSAVQTLQQRLGDDTTGAAGAMRRLGVNADAFGKLGTYQQVLTLSDALRSETDVNERASLGAALFGRIWKEVGPAITANMRQIGDQAPLMADSTVASLDRIDDAMKRAKGQMTAWGGSVVLAIEGAGFAMGDLLSRFSSVPGFVGPSTSEMLKHAAALNDPTGLTRALENAKPPVSVLETGIKALGLSAGEAATLERELTFSAEESIRVNREAAAETKKHSDAIDRLKNSQATYLDLILPGTSKLAQLESSRAIQNGLDAKFTAEGLKNLTNLEETRATGAYKMHLADETANREHMESLALVEQQMTENMIVVGEYANANTSAGAAAKAATSEAVQGYAAVTQQVEMSGEAIREWINLQQYSAAANAIYAENKLFTSRSQLERVSQLPFGGGSSGGGGGSTTVNVNVSGVFDANAKRQLTEAVSSGLTRSVLQGSKVS